MDINKAKGIIEAILFAAGREVSKNEIMLQLELPKEELERIVANMQDEYKSESRGIELITVGDAYQLCTKKELHENIYPILDKRVKPRISGASLETLAIIAYNPRITRAEIEAIRGVSVDACMYKLLEFGLIEESGKSDLPGKPMTYRTTNEFLRKFGYYSLEDLPELPRYKLDANKQIVIDELIEEHPDEASAETADVETEETEQTAQPIESEEAEQGAQPVDSKEDEQVAQPEINEIEEKPEPTK